MLTLYHAPHSRSSRIVALIEELGIRDRIEIRQAKIARRDGTPGDPSTTPHPDGKVPLLVHDGVEIRESNAIALYLTELFPDAGLALPPGHPERGAMLSWLAWYGNVFEPVLVAKFAEIDHPLWHLTFRDMDAAIAYIAKALEDHDYLAGDRYTIADLIVASTFQWAPHFLPDNPRIKAWVERCSDRPAQDFVAQFDAQLTGSS